MRSIPSHEDPFYVVLPRGLAVGEAFARFLDAPGVQHYQLPPLWAFDRSGIDVPGAMPEIPTLTRENLGAFLRDLTLLCDPAALERLVARTWQAVDETVRDHYLRRSALRTMAAIFRLGTPSREVAPPPVFRADRIHDHGFEVEYRLAPARGPHDADAPLEEGTLAYYPFDPANASGREEGGLPPGDEVVLEGFAYAPARGRHADLFRSLGWTVHDPRTPEGG